MKIINETVILSLIDRFEWALPAALFALAALLHGAAPAAAMDSASDAIALAEPEFSPQEKLLEQLGASVSKQYPGAKVTIDPKLHWTHGSVGDNYQSVALLGETSRGEVMFSISAEDGSRAGEGWASFSAMIPARVAVKRVHPGERLDAEMFAVKNVNIAVGQAHELRGVILEPETPTQGLEARQTVIEGQMLLSTSVQRIPDVRRGDSVRVQLISNGLSLSTQGRAEEPAYAGSQIRITASKTKRELVGKLLPTGVVEVKL